LNYVRESIEMYDGTPSEQYANAVSGDPYISAVSNYDRAGALAKIFRAAEQRVGGSGGSSLAERSMFILARARTHNLSPSHYEIIWFIDRTLREHVISNDVTSPAIVGESA
jgi:hypothetical protein